MRAKPSIKSITFGLFNYRLFFTLILFIGWFGAKAADYVFMAQSGNTWHFYAYSSTQSNLYGYATDATSFSYSTCVWSGTSGNYFRNSNSTSYGLYYNLNSYLQNRSNPDLFTIVNNKIHSNNRYICYNNGWYTAQTNNNYYRYGISDILYSISTTSALWTTPVSISGNQSTFTTQGSFTYSANAAYRPTYYTLTGNGTYYVLEGGSPSTNIPASSSTGLTFSWSLNDGTNDDGHVRIDSSTGEVTYYNSYASNTNTTIKVTATHTASGASSSTTKTITFNYLPIANPISITATDKTILQGEAWTADNYTLTTTDGYQAYQFVIAESSNTSVATVANSTGGFTVTGIETGTATITISAYKQGNTEIACTTTFILTVFEPETGVSGGIVTIFDYEDHNWTYYAGVDISVDGGNYNTNYVGKMYSPYPRNVKITYKGNGGAVSISESETEFVYYKTLEQGATTGQYPYTVISNPFSKRPNGKGFGGWRIKEGADYISGYVDEEILPLDAEIVFVNLPYPNTNCTSAEIELEATWVNYNNRTYASGNTFTYSVTGGTYETNFLVLNRNVTGTITVSSPCTIMMVEPDGSADYRNNYSFTGNITPYNNDITKIEFTKWQSTNTVNAGYRHFWIGRGMTTTTGNRCANLITGYNATTSNASPQYSIKVESGIYQYFDFYKGHSTYNGGSDNTTFTVSGSAANAKITMGNDYDRAKGTNNTLQFLYGPMLGYSGNFSNRGNRDNTHTLDLVIKSGTIGSTFFIENTNTANHLQGGAGYCMYLSSAGSQTNVGTRNVIIEGGDICSIGGGIDSYNNAPSNNDNPSTTTNYNRLSFNLRIKGGTIHGNVYGGAAKSPGGGNRVMVMTGGQVKGWFAAGCNGTDNDGGQTYGTSYVYIGGKGKVDSEGLTKTLGYANGGNVYAAGAGRQGATTCGEMTFGTNLVIADNSFIERGIYGGGNYGYALASTNLYITGGTNDGNSGTVNNVTTKGGVFGGANQQDGPNINLYMTGGIMKGGVYGGCNTQGTISNNVTMQINGGEVGTTNQTANIHGGGYGQATRVSGNVEVTLGKSEQTEDGVTVYGDVYGGSALGNVNSNTSNTTLVNLTGGTIHGDAYGGGLGDSSNAAYVNGNVTVTLNGTAFVTTTTTDDEGNIIPASGRIFGCNNLNGTPKGTVLVKVLKTTPVNGATRAKGTYELQAVYGGGNLAAYNPTDPLAEGQFTEYSYSNVTASHDNTDKPVQVVIDGCDETSIEYVYGGGNAAPTPATDVTVIGCYEIGNVFGGGNGKDKYTLDGGTTWNPNNGADVGYKGTTSYGTGKSLASVYGGTVHYIFGGSNTKGNIRVIAEAAIDDASDCPLDVEEIYGGGNEAYMEGDSKISLGCIDFLQEIYGGAKNADVGGDIELTITSGHFDRVFGGNNLGGTIEGSITVNIEETGCNPITIGELYGCGNAAAYTTPSGKTDPTINIKSFTSIGRVFGGGLGEGAVVTGNPTVNINEVVGANASMTPTTIYAGTTRTLSDNTTVTLPDHTAGEIGAIGTVFGGGNAAAVNGNTNVYVGTEPTITYVSKTTEPIPVVGVDIRGNVYGGGNAADVTGSTNVVIGQ